jgi:hypothetical protein
MPKVRDRLATELVSEIIQPYLTASTDEREIGDSEFDDCAMVIELADFLASKIRMLLR